MVLLGASVGPANRSATRDTASARASVSKSTIACITADPVCTPVRIRRTGWRPVWAASANPPATPAFSPAEIAALRAGPCAELPARRVRLRPRTRRRVAPGKRALSPATPATTVAGWPACRTATPRPAEPPARRAQHLPKVRRPATEPPAAWPAGPGGTPVGPAVFRTT